VLVVDLGAALEGPGGGSGSSSSLSSEEASCSSPAMGIL